MNHNGIVLRLQKLTLYGVIFLLIILLLVQSEHVISAVQNALLLCYQTVIPSLFPFFVLSGMLTAGNFIKKLAKLLSPVMYPLFHISGAGALPFTIGIISGYPMGAKVTTELYLSGAISRQEAARLLPFTNNSGPLFIIGAVGTGMLNQPSLGIYLYCIHVLCALLVGFCFRFYHGSFSFDERQKSTGSLAQTLSFSDVVAKSVNTMLLVCGFIIFFAAVCACLTPLLDTLPKSLSLFIKGILEVTNGSQIVAQSMPAPRLMLSILSGIIGFGGICVMLQVAGIVTPAGLSMKTYAIGKILHGIFSAITCYCLYPLFTIKVQPAFAVTAPMLPIPNVIQITVSLIAVLACFYLFYESKTLCKTVKK